MKYVVTLNGKNYEVEVTETDAIVTGITEVPVMVAAAPAVAPVAAPAEAPVRKKKLSFKEQREMEQLEKDVEALAAEKAELETQLGSGTLPFDQLQAASQRIGEIIEETDEKELRLLELYENL